MGKIDTHYDIIIIGGGPAGLTAALYAGRSKVSTLLLENKILGGQLLNTELIDDYPGAKSVLGTDLADIMVDQARTFGTVIVSANVDTITVAPDGNKVVTTDHGTFIAPSVIVTAGGVPRKLEVSGEIELAGRGVSYCAVCDGAFFQNKELVVVGGGDAAVEEALFLTRYASKVTIVHRRDTFRAQSILINEAEEHPKIACAMNAVVTSINGIQAVESVTLKDVITKKTRDLATQGVFIFVGFLPNTNLVSEHVNHDSQGYYQTDPWSMMTNVPGIFAAGDVRAQLTRQITTAVGDATTASIAAVKWAEAVKKGTPLPFNPIAVEAHAHG